MRVLAIDLGDARTGFALSDKGGVLASPLETFSHRSTVAIAEQARRYADEYEVGEIVLGLPLNMNGTEGPRAQKSREFALLLKELMPDIEIILRDERGTTVSAAGALNRTNTRGKKRKDIIDTVAAVILLQSYLDYKKNRPQ